MVQHVISAQTAQTCILGFFFVLTSTTQIARRLELAPLVCGTQRGADHVLLCFEEFDLLCFFEKEEAKEHRATRTQVMSPGRSRFQLSGKLKPFLRSGKARRRNSGMAEAEGAKAPVETVFERLEVHLQEAESGAEEVVKDHPEEIANGTCKGEVSKEETRLDVVEREIAALETELAAANFEQTETSANTRSLEIKKVNLQRLNYERDQILLAEKHVGKKLAFNLLVCGNSGSGKSSSLNSLLNKQACKVSGAQAQGTRGCVMQDGFISDESFVSFIDTQGLGADTSVTDSELLSQIMMSTESVSKMMIINNILISFDTNTRGTPATMANQLTLMELFGELRHSCFLILTKWNTNAVQVEWNRPLRTWTKKWRRARSIDEITEDPPSYAEMYEAYTKYILDALNNDEDAGAFSKMGTFLSFFQARVLWMYNLDSIQVEDMEAGELDPYLVKLYTFYREKALQCLKRGSTTVPVEELTFLKEDEDTLAKVAERLIASRDEKIERLEKIGLDSEKRLHMRTLFTEMAEQNTTKISNADFDVKENKSMDKIAELAGFQANSTQVGCSLQ